MLSLVQRETKANDHDVFVTGNRTVCIRGFATFPQPHVSGKPSAMTATLMVTNEPEHAACPSGRVALIMCMSNPTMTLQRNTRTLHTSSSLYNKSEPSDWCFHLLEVLRTCVVVLDGRYLYTILHAFLLRLGDGSVSVSLVVRPLAFRWLYNELFPYFRFIHSIHELRFSFRDLNDLLDQSCTDLVLD